MPLGSTWCSALARNWWWPRCEPLTVSSLVSASTEPTAPPSWPMLECAGPWIRPGAGELEDVLLEGADPDQLGVDRAQQGGVGGVPVRVGGDDLDPGGGGRQPVVLGHDGLLRSTTTLTQDWIQNPDSRDLWTRADAIVRWLFGIQSDPGGVPMALPGLRRVDHIGFTVPDLDEAHRVPGRRPRLRVPLLPRPVPPRRRLDDRRTSNVASARGDGREPLLPLRRPGASSRSSTTPRPTSATRCRATATSAATTSRCTSTTSTPPSSTCGRRACEVLDGPTASRGPAEGNRWIYFLSPWGMQFELVSYPGRQGLRPGESATMSTTSRSTSTTPAAPASARVAAYLREAILQRRAPARATGSARRTSPSGSAPAGCRCARRCGCWRPRASPSTSPTRARGCRGSPSTRST